MLLMSSFSLGVVAVIHRLIIFLSMPVSFVGRIVCLHFHFVLSIIYRRTFKILFRVLTWKITLMCVVRISLITFVEISQRQIFLITKADMYTTVELLLLDISTLDSGKPII